MESGTKLVAQAGSTMKEIVLAISHVTDIMAQISSASVEQSDGIQQINLAIHQMDDVTQEMQPWWKRRQHRQRHWKSRPKN